MANSAGYHEPFENLTPIAGLEQRYGGVVATTFRNFPSFPQRYMEPCTTLPIVCGATSSSSAIRHSNRRSHGGPVEDENAVRSHE